MRITDMTSGEESILLYQVESLASSCQVHACMLPAAGGPICQVTYIVYKCYSEQATD